MNQKCNYCMTQGAHVWVLIQKKNGNQSLPVIFTPTFMAPCFHSREEEESPTCAPTTGCKVQGVLVPAHGRRLSHFLQEGDPAIVDRVRAPGPHDGKRHRLGSEGHILVLTCSLKTIQTSYSVIFGYYAFLLS